MESIKEKEAVAEFFESNEAPAGLAEEQQRLDEFVRHNAGRKLALVTSGGTTVPLEKNTVRYIDNFSGGNRGACSAEYPLYPSFNSFHKYFLENGYAVIFLSRVHSLHPYSRYFLLQHKVNHQPYHFIDFLHLEDSSVSVVPEHQVEVASLVAKYQVAQKERRLLVVHFVSIHQYLHLLRACSLALAPIKEKGLIYSAAAVSDFYIPLSQMAEHKIQSSAHPDGLTLQLQSVPKMLRSVVADWAPGCFVVSFKLETDETILTRKATGALRNYGHQLVIGNLLSTYKDEVHLFTHNSPNLSDDGQKEEEAITIKRVGKDIEAQLVPAVIALHEAHILTQQA
ncbi:Phosphopantothenate--cysteine ligase cab2 [Balamuthia mandrillaris]